MTDGQTILNLTNFLLVTGLLLILAELIAGIDAGFDLVLIGSILIISGLLNLLIPNPVTTLIFAAVLSAVYILIGRKLIRKNTSIRTHKTNIDSLVGKKGVVIETITKSAAGLVKIEDEKWRARAEKKIEKNAEVEVLSVEGVTLIVK